MRAFRRAVRLIALVTAMAGCAVPEQAAAPDLAPPPVPAESIVASPESPPRRAETRRRAPAIPTRPGRVTHIVDGDTIDVRLSDGSVERIRFIGVDTPERGDDLFARASQYTASKAVVGSVVHLELDVEHRDRYSRLLAYVWLSKPLTGTNTEATKTMLNALLVRKGLARTLTIQPNSNYADLFAQLQRRAREAKLNLWDGSPFSAPAPPKPSGKCHPNYSGKCLKPDSYDYDCKGGSGDGPDYTDGPVYVEGEDPYELDGNGDGVACE